MDSSIKAGITGVLLAVFINLLSPTYLDFIPSFLAAVLAVYFFKLGTLREGLVASFMTYIFTDGILGTITLAILYFTNEPYPSFNVDVWTMFSPVVSAITAVIAAYIGVWISRKMMPARELQQVIQPRSPTT